MGEKLHTMLAWIIQFYMIFVLYQLKNKNFKDSSEANFDENQYSWWNFKNHHYRLLWVTRTHKYVSLSDKTVLGAITNHLGVILLVFGPRSDVARDTLLYGGIAVATAARKITRREVR